MASRLRYKMGKFDLSQILLETSPAEQAKLLGLTYGGFGGWIDPVTRKVVAKTVQGHLVRTDDGNSTNSQDNLGRLDVMYFSTALADFLEKLTGTVQLKKFGELLHTLIKIDNNFILLYNSLDSKKIVKYLMSIGIKTGIKMHAIDNPDSNKVKDFVKQKIQDGYRDIHYYDTNQNGVEGVKSLRAPYNKVKNLVIDPHWIKELDTTKTDTAKIGSHSEQLS